MIVVFLYYLGCKRRIDVGFLVDVSRFVGRRNLVKILAFVKKMVQSFTLSSRYVRVSVVTFSSRTQRFITFTRGTSRRAVLRVIKRIRYRGGLAYTGRALNYVKRYIFYGRPKCGKKRVLIVISSSVSRDSVVRPAKGLTAIGVETYVIVTNSRVYRNLRVLATTRSHMIMTSYRLIGRLSRSLALKICVTPIGKLRLFQNY